METEEGKNHSLGYVKPPWEFRGSALYQLHLVKSETARAFIPQEFRLVEAFGYTLGGFFLANYEDSPVGKLDELVVIAGIVWNPPTSCAWAARVLVSSNEACVHGRKEVGLPSQVASFTKSAGTLPPSANKTRIGGFLRKVGVVTSLDNVKNRMQLQVREINEDTSVSLCNINFTSSAAPQNDAEACSGLALKFSLPSFSGRTTFNPHLLKYSCQIECRLRAAALTDVSAPYESDACNDVHLDKKRELSMSVMLSKPILALEFNCLKMKVEAPSVVSE